MRRKLEYWAAAAALAEEGAFDEARALLRELGQLEKSRRAKILVVADDNAVNREVSLSLAGLAQRLSSELLFVSSSAESLASGRLPEGVAALRKMLSRGLRLVYVPAAGHVEEVVRLALGRVHRVEFAVLLGQENKPLAQTLAMPVFSL